MTGRAIVVGIGADGVTSLSVAARAELDAATVIYGSSRQLDLLPSEITAERIIWRSPLAPHIAQLSAELADTDIHILASGDPMFHGIGSTLVRALGADRVHVLPTPSSASLAAARLGWDLATTRVVSLVTAPVTSLRAALTHGRRLLVLSSTAATPSEVAALLRDSHFGNSEITVLSDLGAPTERIDCGTARALAGEWSALNIIAIDCVGPARSNAPGLDDSAFFHDGQITKSPIRALTVSALRPTEGSVLWDVGAGSGSIGVEWLRQLDTGRVIAFESHPDRAATIIENATRHGVGSRLEVRAGAPQSFDGADSPDVIFVGGGLNADLLKAVWSALAPGGRIVANAVTIETEALLVEAARTHGGELLRVSVERAAPLGRSTAWRPSLPIVQWSATKGRRILSDVSSGSQQ